MKLESGEVGLELMIIGEGGVEPGKGEAGSELIIIGEGGLELLLLPKEVGGGIIGY